MIIETNNLDEFFEHHGVRGQKWGIRNEQKAHLRSLNKTSKADTKAKRISEIDAARAHFKSGNAKQDVKDAKAKYKADKMVIGKHAAKQTLLKTRASNNEQWAKANKIKDGKDLAKHILKAALISPEYATATIARQS